MQGLMGISISPAIQTTPALDSLFPIYWEDLTDEQKQRGVTINLETTDTLSGEYAVTVTPTAEWYAFTNSGVSQNKGEAVQTPILAFGDSASVSASVAETLNEEDEDARHFRAKITIAKSGK